MWIWTNIQSNMFTYVQNITWTVVYLAFSKISRNTNPKRINKSLSLFSSIHVVVLLLTFSVTHQNPLGVSVQSAKYVECISFNFLSTSSLILLTLEYLSLFETVSCDHSVGCSLDLVILKHRSYHLQQLLLSSFHHIAKELWCGSICELNTEGLVYTVEVKECTLKT